MPKYWISVVSQDHIRQAVAWGILQVCHGKAYPLKRMKADDWVVNYSPVKSLATRKKCQRFTAIGQVKTGMPYQVDMGNGFLPFRIDVNYLPCQEAPIRPLIPALSFITNPKRWGYRFRLGHFGIEKADFCCIAAAMGVKDQIQ